MVDPSGLVKKKKKFRLAQKKDETEDGGSDSGKKQNPVVFFFHIFKTHENENYITYANIYRLFKYYRFFDKFDFIDQVRHYVIYPEQIPDQVLFLSRKLKKIILLYSMMKKLPSAPSRPSTNNITVLIH